LAGRREAERWRSLAARLACVSALIAALLGGTATAQSPNARPRPLDLRVGDELEALNQPIFGLARRAGSPSWGSSVPFELGIDGSSIPIIDATLWRSELSAVALNFRYPYFYNDKAFGRPTTPHLADIEAEFLARLKGRDLRASLGVDFGYWVSRGPASSSTYLSRSQFETHCRIYYSNPSLFWGYDVRPFFGSDFIYFRERNDSHGHRPNVGGLSIRAVFEVGFAMSL
jgi:hypothetical protein